MIVAAVSGGPDSVFLLHAKLPLKKGTPVAIGHVNYGIRGKDSDEDQRLVEKLGRLYGMETRVLKVSGRKYFGKGHRQVADFPVGFEKRAREIRHDYFNRLASRKAGMVAMAHTADDQVETILMRVFEGAGISGLKGIPRETADGIVRPILHIWKEDILKYLKKHNIPYRIDKSNFDTRFERNWIRHVLIPLLEKRYGKGVKKRIYTLGERFRELDDYLEAEARKWMRGKVKAGKRAGGQVKIVGKVPTKGNEGNLQFSRGVFSRLPALLRVKIFQRICFDWLGVAPNERLLASMDRLVREGGPSASVKVGKGWELKNRYGEAAFVPAGNGKKRGNTSGAATGTKAASPAAKGSGMNIIIDEKGKATLALARRSDASGGKEYFDAAGIRLPLSIRPLRAGDRIRPFGLASEKKVKEILIDRKVPREERWGRPVVCDAEGKILWIPGVIRSDHAPVTPRTRKTVLLQVKSANPGKAEPPPRPRK